MKKVDNQQLLEALQCMEANFDKKLAEMQANFDKRFEDMVPYIETLKEIKGAGRVFSWIMGVLMAGGGALLMFKQLYNGS